MQEADRGCYMCQVRSALVPSSLPCTAQINTETMKQQLGCLDVNVPPDINYEQTSKDVVVQVTALHCTSLYPELCTGRGQCYTAVQGQRPPAAPHHMAQVLLNTATNLTVVLYTAQRGWKQHRQPAGWTAQYAGTRQTGLKVT